ncbi:phosphate-induced protein 1 conserved region-domain-containing protein [Endogone sp. FLAS-F59071]|nr:phosphate-induced protein 1 conserved region-domain-containing protein [Endogone sp. FLAS-F59071]|eukprot:RUS15495.1 phosphate-induced protein 1 conserved region-domain-containing protein [Endogone sp. FLAS-F59071]
MRFFLLLLATVLTLAVLASGSAAPRPREALARRDDNESGDNDFVPASSNSPSAQAQLTYKGGKILTGTVSYITWYGNWNHSSYAQGIVTHFINNLDSTSWFQTETLYKDNTGAHISGPLRVYSPSSFDHYSHGKNLTYNDHISIITRQLQQGSFPVDPTGLYVVFTSADVNSKDFCTSICGYHASLTVVGQTMVMAVIADGGVCNPSPGIDALINVFAHEVMEAMSDPFLDAWFGHSSTGDIVENADKCNLIFGDNVKTFSNGAKWNLEVAGEKFYVQQVSFGIDGRSNS